MTPEQRIAARDLAIALESDSGFRDLYEAKTMASGRRNLIKDFAKSLNISPLSVIEREQIRRYFDETWRMHEATGDNSHANDLTIDLFDDGRVTANDIKQTETQPEEIPMNTAPIAVTTKTFVNGRDISDLADAEIYELIANEEMKIKELGKIENKPKRLQAEIERRGEGIVALVAYLDSKPD